MANNSEIFKKQGYIVLPQGLNQDDMAVLESSDQTLSRRAGEFLAELAESGESLSDFYKRNDDELIVVPEIDDPLKVCRYEYINGYNEAINSQIVPKLKTTYRRAKLAANSCCLKTSATRNTRVEEHLPRTRM